MEVVEYKNIKFNVWDLGGQDSIVCYHFPQTRVLCFLVTSS